jgi:soluble lytic murein transglycosylase-like protein
MRRLAAAVAVLLAVSAPIGRADAAGASCARYSGLLAAAGLPVRTFQAIAWRETRCNPHAVSRSHDYGLLQINRIHLRHGGAAAGYTAAQLLDPATNIAVAARLYHRAGLRPWRVR